MRNTNSDPATSSETGALSAMLAQSARRSPYFVKDLGKARQATQFIGQGSPQSSTAAYAKSVAPHANTGRYTASDVVFVSAEGNRRGRINPIATSPNGAYKNLDLAIAVGARFIIDQPADRDRAYNIGERQIAAYLLERGYRETAPGLFSPP